MFNVAQYWRRREIKLRQYLPVAAMAFVGRYEIRFATMSDGELERAVSNSSVFLNKSASHALARELWRRGLGVEPENGYQGGENGRDTGVPRT